MTRKTQSSEQERRAEEIARNQDRRRDWYLEWIAERPLLADMPPAMNWRWHRDVGFGELA